MYIRFSIICIRFLLPLILLQTVASSFALEQDKQVKNIYFGKYDEYAFVIYEQTYKLPKKDRLISAVTVAINPFVQCDYKLLFTMPKAVSDMQIWDSGSWYKLRQGGQSSYAINTKSATHRLKDNIYSIRGSVATAKKGGFIRGVLKGESLVVGDYNLDVYIDDKLIKSIAFAVYPPFSSELR